MKTRKRGVALVTVLLILLILLIMVIGFTYENQTQASFNAAVTLENYYRTAANSLINEQAATLDAWVTASHNTTAAMASWRFGNLLAGAPDANYPQYGILLASSFDSDGLGDGTISANAGMMELDYRVYVANNRDDPSHFYSSQTINNQTVDSTWDMDGKVVLTVQIFSGDTDDAFTFGVDHPVSTVSAMVQSTGVDQVLLGASAGSEGDDLTNSLNSGQGSSDAGLNPSGSSPLSLSVFQGN